MSTAALHMIGDRLPTPELPQLVFDINDRGYRIYAYYLPEPNHGLAQVEIFKDGAEVRVGKYEAYRIWNLAAHFSDIVDDAIENGIPRERGLRAVLDDWRGRLGNLFAGKSFIYRGKSRDWPDHYDVEVLVGGHLVTVPVCDDEIFHDPTKTKEEERRCVNVD